MRVLQGFIYLSVELLKYLYIKLKFQTVLQIVIFTGEQFKCGEVEQKPQ